MVARAEPDWKPDLYVVARFLDRLWEPESSYTRSQLQMATRVNYDLFRRYLAFLHEKGFVVVSPADKGGDIIKLTMRGREAHAVLVEWIRRVVGESVL